MKKILFYSVTLLLGANLLAQNVGIGTNTPDASARLHIVDPNRGIIIPNVALTATNASGPVTSPATSLLVYNTATAGTAPNNVWSGFYYWNGSSWVRLDTGNGDWKLLGNAGTNETVNFIGTTDAQGLTVRTNNLERFRFSGPAYQLLSMGNGTAGAPAYSFNSENNSGMYRSGAGSLSLSTVGIERLRVTNTPQVLSGTQGTAAAPAWAYTAATGTGIYAPLTTALGFSANGTEQFRITSGNQLISMFNGSAAAPNYTWNTSTTSGFYMPAASTLGFSTASTQRMRINGDGEVVVGTVATSPLGGDLLNAVAYGALTWAVNGYTNLNAGAVYGNRMAGASGAWGTVQGEDVSNVANSSGTVGSVNANSQRGAYGAKPPGGAGWGGLFLNDLGYSGGFFNVSDARFKKNIRPVQTVLDKVMQLTPYMYHYTLEPLGGEAYNYIGFMAQDVEKVFPDLVAEKSVVPAYSRFNSENNGKYDKVLDKVKCVSTIGLIPILTKALQEQQQIIESQNQRIEELEKAIKKLEERIK